MDYKKILTDIARAIVDSPDQVSVTETVEEDEIKLVLTVAPEDTGMVIGRHGKIAKAIRSDRSFQKNGQFSFALYQGLLRENSLTPERFEQFLKRNVRSA